MALDSTTTPEASRSGNLHKGTKTHKPGCACPFCSRKRNDTDELERVLAQAISELPSRNDDDGVRVLQNTLNESRKIAQEREKQLATAQAELRSANIALDWQKAEVSRLAESLRLAEQGRDKALVDLSRSETTRDATEQRLVAKGREVAKMTERIDTLGNDLDQAGEHIRALTEERDAYQRDNVTLTNQLAEMERLRNAAEGRYMALLQRGTLEATIVIIATVAVLLVASAVVVFGGAR